MKGNLLKFILFSFFCFLYYYWKIGVWFYFYSISVFGILILSLFLGFLYESNKMVTSVINEMTLPRKTETAVNAFSNKETMDSKVSHDKRVSGSSIIDDALNNFLQFLMRDNFEKWYSQITSDTEFISESRQIIQKMAMITSNRCKEVDWLSFFTGRFVDIILNHIKLFKKAKAYCDLQNKELASKDAEEMLLFKFVQLETCTSEKKVSWISVAKESTTEKMYLKVIVDLILQQLASKEESICRPLQLLSSQIFSGEMIIPMFDMLSDPDYINQIIIWLCRHSQITSDSFLTVIRYSDNLNELVASRLLLLKEIAILRSHDFGDADILVKRRLSSLLYVKQLIENQLNEVSEGNCSSFQSWNDYYTQPSQSSIYQIPLHVMLKNNVALSYLLDYMATIDSQVYIFFLLNVEGWKAAASEQSSLKHELCPANEDYQDKSSISSDRRPSATAETNSSRVASDLKDSAISIYEQYFSDLAEPRILVDDSVMKRMKQSLFIDGNVADSCFDEVTLIVTSQIENTEQYLPSFRKSVGYLRMLAELDLLKPRSKNEENLTEDSGNNLTVPTDYVKSLKEEKFENLLSCSSTSYADDVTLSASISQQGVVKDGLTSHAVYAVNVVKLIKHKEVDSWFIYRRYSDFYDFHLRLQEKFKCLKELTFPEKRVFNNMGKSFLERRQYLLNEYIKQLLNPEKLKLNPGLQETLFHFFERGSYEHSKGSLSRKVDSLMNPIVTSVRTVSKAVRMETTDYSKPGFNQQSFFDDRTCYNLDADDKIPLRILLELMDEVFDLHNRNQWLRKRLYYMLRDILRAMYGDVFNQKIVDYVQIATSPEQVADLIYLLRDSLWPNGASAMPRPSRDDATKLRTRVAAKASLLSWFPDEVKHVIGNETTREGVLRLFELFQNPVLNRRLVFVIVEELINTLFPESNLEVLFKSALSQKT